MNILPSIVAIGASAGGLHSFRCFLSALPDEFGFSIIFMQHLSTKHKSLLAELLNKSRPSLDILEVSDNSELLPGKVYLCPPGKDVSIRKEVFHITAQPTEHLHLPIDEFFSSLAGEAGDRVIGVIFSGAGTDGARGIQEIRNGGGAVFVEDPAAAEFPSMPLAAIATGQADGVFKPEEIAREILKMQGAAGVAPTPASGITPAQFEAFYSLLHDKAGYNFNLYKKSVVSRRIIRRMYLRGITTVDDYLKFLSENAPEVGSLLFDLMIGVTSFFRDPLAWKALKTGVIRKIAAQDDDSPVRVWTPASATGEEAYSIAMMLHHELELAGRRREIQVFATDVNERAVEKAREGRYPGSISAEISPEFMKKYFTYTEDGLYAVISKEIRGLVVFAKHDILTDPPFSRLDLVICRNLLIYLEPEAQEKCIALFHYSLRNGGFLFLGNAESPGRNISLFKSLAHKKCRIYEKVETKPFTRMPISVPFASEKAERPVSTQKAEECRQSVTGIVQEALLEGYAPAAVAVDRNYDIVYHNGPTNRYLCQPRGAPTRNLLELMPENLRNRLRSRIRGGLYKAIHEARVVSVSTSIIGDDKRKRQVALRISKLKEDLFLIVFADKSGLPGQAETASLESAAVEEAAVRQLENELSSTRQDLQSKIEQLRSLNEEMQSSNEELQAANEELETSREELQSLNEELITVNSQLQTKIEEQETTNNDLNNFLGSTNIPTIFLDHRFRVKRYTPAMSRFIKLIPADVGRPIMDMSQESLGPELIADARCVLEQLAPVKRELSIDGSWHVRTVLPYRTADNRIEGVVVTYADVTDLRRAEESTRHLASFPQLNPNPVLELDTSGKISFSNPGTQKILETLGLDGKDAGVFLPADIEGIVGKWDRKVEATFQREVTIKDRTFSETIYLSPQFGVARIYAFEITERRRTEEALRESEEGLKRAQEIAHLGSWELDLAADRLTWSDEVYRIFGLDPQEFAATYEAFLEAVHPDDRAAVDNAYSGSLREGRDAYEIEHRVVRKDTGEIRFVHEKCEHFRDRGGKIIRSVGMVHDITERKRAEMERETAVKFLRLVNESRDTEGLLRSATDFFQRKSGCEAVGIRLRQEHDYPYYETRGFPKEFVLLENRLCARDKEGKPVLDSMGDPVLECMCGNVICGRFDPSKPFFTPKGSFWTNSTTELLATTTDADRQARTRNRCNGEGYESVALLALRSGDERLGLLQLNDKRRGLFTPGIIALWERLADYLAVALAKFEAEEKTRLKVTELNAANDELLKFNRVMEGREIRMIELKKEINELCGRAGLDPRYPLDFEEERK